MTQEQYYWFIRRQQLLKAYTAQQNKAAGGSVYSERRLKPNLKEVWYDDFTEAFDIIPDDDASSFKSNASFGACSSVRRGNFHGRNFDFTFDPRTTYVIHVKDNAAKKRHAFAGIAKASFNDDIPDMTKMPNLLKDGINDCNVVVNINVVSKIDLDDAGLKNTSTNPGKRRVHCDCVPSYILAYADSAVDAIRIMKNEIDIYGYLKGSGPEANEYLHYMISDMKNTFVVEIIGNRLCVIGYGMNADNDKVYGIVDQFIVDPDEFPNPIMTNWYLNYSVLPEKAIVKDGKYTYHGCGIERFRILSDNYDKAASVFDLMKLARYKNEILMDVSDPNFPFSDATGRSIYDYQAYIDFSELAQFIDGDRAKMRDAFDNNKRNLGVWLTSHNTVYDIENKTFTLVFEEDYDHPMSFEM